MLEDFLELLAGETPAATVWTADLSYWIAGRRQDGTAAPAWGSEEGYLKFHRDLNVMPYFYYDRFWIAEPQYDATVNSRRETTARGWTRSIETPVGSIREESVFLPESCCDAVSKHMVETEADLDVMLYALEHRHLNPINLNDYQQRRQLWAQYDGIPCLGLPRSPLPALVYEWAGLQNSVMLLLDCRDKVLHALDLLERQEAPILEALCELAPPLVHFPDNLSSDNLTGYYDEHMRNRHQLRLQKLHAAGIKAAVHLDGAVRGLLPKLIDAGFDAIEALTPKPVGDITVEEMATIAQNDKVILWGGVPGAMFAAPHAWNDMSTHVDHVLETWGQRPFVLGVADQVPPDGDIEFCRKIANATRPGRP